jgi:glycosyltransferase involved in cell wall biosynthesis
MGHSADLSQADFRFNPFNADDAQWAEPDSDDLAEKMQWVVTHYAAKTIALRGRDYLLANFTWEKMGQKLKNVVFNL